MSSIVSEVASLEKSMANLESGLSSGKWAKLFLALVILGFAALLAWFLYSKYKMVQSKEYMDKVQAALTERQTHYMPIIERRAKESIDRLLPIVTPKIQQQFSDDMPALRDEFEKQQGPFIKNLQSKFEDKFTKQADLMKAEMLKILKEEFKEEDPKVLGQITDNFQVAMTKLGKKMYVEPVAAELTKMEGTWKAFPSNPKANPDRLNKLLKDLFFDLVGRIADERKADKPVGAKPAS